MINPVMLFTRKSRADMALKYIPKRGIHLDLGCGKEQYLLQRSPARKKIGLDKELGVYIKDKIPVKRADCITMLAMIEHLEFPAKIIKECHRVLSKNGVLIITTPKEKADKVIKFYTGRSEKEMRSRHKHYFDYLKMEKLVGPYFKIIKYQPFQLGFNQLFVCKKINP